MPMFSGKVNYIKTIDLSADALKTGRYKVALGAWLGSAAEVLVNGKKAGLIAFAPSSSTSLRRSSPEKTK